MAIPASNCTRSSSFPKPSRDFSGSRAQRDPRLLGGVAVANRHRVVVQCLSIHGEAPRRARLVLSAITPAHGALVVVLNIPPALEFSVQGLRFFRHAILIDEREDGGLHGGEPRMKTHDGPRFTADLILGERFT